MPSSLSHPMRRVGNAKCLSKSHLKEKVTEEHEKQTCQRANLAKEQCFCTSHDFFDTPCARNLTSKHVALSNCMAPTGAPHKKYQIDKNQDPLSHTSKKFCQYPEPPERACCAAKAGEPAKLPTEYVLLALAASNATYCCAAAAGSTSRNDTMHKCCIMLRSSVGEAGQDFSSQGPPSLEPTMQQSTTLGTHSPTYMNLCKALARGHIALRCPVWLK